MNDLLSRLQAAVGTAYRIEKELGGGGMSRVFLAEEVNLGRKVVLKVLPPEMAAGVNADRFRREIQLAASLQHPHIVPLLTAGSQGDLLWYVMPFIEGESLRAKLAREGELPIGDVLRILKEVLDALAYAHAHHVVHRDIKPDNVLLSGRHAVVTDFGVAKAVSASTGESSLTSLGVALGTPAYMAPEQAAADPNVDHRADIYAAGAMAYEMLCGRPPFVGGNAQSILSAHITQAPDPVTRHRETVPPALNELVLRCLAKKPADRPQTADDLVPYLDALLTPTGGITPTGTRPVPAVDYDARARRAHPARVMVLYAVSSIAVLALAFGLVQAIGLPDWVFAAAIGLIAAGLPIIIVTGQRERQRALATASGTFGAVSDGMDRHFTWRKALLGGSAAFAGLALLSGAFMTLRALGIGPFGTLMSSGTLNDRERIVLAEFANVTTDTTLGGTVTELFGIDLAQSPSVTVLESPQVAAVLRRMGRNPETRVNEDLAIEVAQREGVKAVLTGEIRPVGGGFVVSSRLVAAATGEALWAGRETAANGEEVVTAVDRLSASLRERIGESLRTIRADAALEQVTTHSMPALRKYAEGIRANNVGDYDRAIARLEEAIALDSTFAMAHRKLGVVLNNNAIDTIGRNRASQEITRAFELRDKLTEPERYLAEGSYYTIVKDDAQAASAAYVALLEKYPTNRTALHNLANEYMNGDKLQEAADLQTRSLALGGAPALTYQNAVGTLYRLGHTDSANRIVDRFERDYPGQPNIPTLRASLAAARFEYDSAEAILRGYLTANRGNAAREERALDALGSLAVTRGRLKEAIQFSLETYDVAQRLGRPYTRTRPRESTTEWLRGLYAFRYHGNAEAERRLFEAQVRRDPPGVTNYLNVAEAYADFGQGARAREYVNKFADKADARMKRNYNEYEPFVLARVALAEGNKAEAVTQIQRYVAVVTCTFCSLYRTARVYDDAGQADSAIANYERYLTTPDMNRMNWDASGLWSVYKRLGELYEARGNREKALQYYNEFVDLWKNADAELQPMVTDVKGRIARLVAERS